MFFTLSKAVWLFLQPSAFLMLLTLFGVVLHFFGIFRGGRFCLIIGSVGLLLIAFSPFGRQLMIPLEDRFPLWEEGRVNRNIAAPTGIVVLGGTIEMHVSDARGVPSIVSGAERIIEAVKLAKRFPEMRIVLAGGPNTVFSTPTADAEIVKQLMVDMGVRPERLEIEGKSQNSWQNAVFSKQVANPKKKETWLLVTSAYHMPRAMGCFRQAGFPVTAFPVDYLTGGEKTRFDFFYYALDGITITDIAAKEWLGLLVYKLTERSSHFFPGP